MSFTFLAKSRAYSWKMSFEGQVDCQRIVIGPWALAIIGNARAEAPAAPARNLRREMGVAGFATGFLSVMGVLLGVGCSAFLGKLLVGRVGPVDGLARQV